MLRCFHILALAGLTLFVQAQPLRDPVSHLEPLAQNLAGTTAARFEAEHVDPLVAATPGAAVIIVDRGRVVLRKTYGVRHAGKAEPITTDTRFRIASISKTFASTAAAILVRETDVNWHAPLKADLADLEFKQPEWGSQISLHHLMSQSTGLMPHAYTNLVEDNMSYRRIIERLNRVDFICPPGDCYGYQNVVFSLVGDVIQVHTSMDYESFVEAKLFQPLAMRRASFGLAAFQEDADHARPHVWTGTRWAAVRSTPHYYRVAPAAGVNASISDMERWLLAQLGHSPEVLDTAMLDELHTGVIATTRHQAHYRSRKSLGNVFYGRGFRVFDYGEHRGYVHHGGYVRGMRSEMVFNRELQQGMVFLTNSEPQGVSDLVFEFVEFYQRSVDGGGLAASMGR